MADEAMLDQVQERITGKYLGKAGIHGVGIRRKKSAIVLYVEAAATEQHNNTLTKIKQEVEPYNLIIVEEDRSSTSSS
jgi:hypothetical protein